MAPTAVEEQMSEQTGDIVQLDLGTVDEIDYATYDPKAAGQVRTSFRLPPEGVVVTGQVADVVTITKNNSGYLNISAGPVQILDETYKGARVQYADFSAKRWKNQNTSFALQFLAACGIDARPTTPEEYKQLAEACAGRTFQFTVQWRGKNPDTGELIEGMENFPQNEDGTYQSMIRRGEGLKPIFANLRIRNLISAI
jgi:hypothetical protein